MNRSSDFRRTARESLRGKWIMAVVVGFIVSLLGGLGSKGPEVQVNMDLSGTSVSVQYAGQTILSTNGGLNTELGALIADSFLWILVAAIIVAVGYFVLGSIIEIGYARFNLELIDGQEARIETLLTYLYHWKTTALARILQSLYIMLWSLLFIIPGIIAKYSYAMTGYILAEHPEMTAGEAINRSKEMMSGNRWRLFCLQLSFIGWSFLCAFTFGIGKFWLTPYKQAATAAFYRELS